MWSSWSISSCLISCQSWNESGWNTYCREHILASLVLPTHNPIRPWDCLWADQPAGGLWWSSPQSRLSTLSWSPRVWALLWVCEGQMTSCPRVSASPSGCAGAGGALACSLPCSRLRVLMEADCDHPLPRPCRWVPLLPHGRNWKHLLRTTAKGTHRKGHNMSMGRMRRRRRRMARMMIMMIMVIMVRMILAYYFLRQSQVDLLTLWLHGYLFSSEVACHQLTTSFIH